MNPAWIFRLAALALAGGLAQSVAASASSTCYSKRDTWAETMVASRTALEAANLSRENMAATVEEVLAALERDFPVPWDWSLQDSQGDLKAWFTGDRPIAVEESMVRRALQELGSEGRAFADDLRRLPESSASSDRLAWLNLYARVGERRRQLRLAPMLARHPRILFTKHYNLGGSHYAYTEGQSDAQNERTFVPGSALCLLEFEGHDVRVRTLIEDAPGVIRDPEVSWDGRQVLFSWKKSESQDDYHLYEMEAASGVVRQITFGQGFADYEGAYLPNADLVFTSTRCVQTVDCWWTEVSNLYTCGPDGQHLRRLTFDQVHDNYPTVMPDGRVVYTRWEYNDRGQLFVQGLFQMNPDGTAQSEFYGNNSWFPTSILHARGIPGTQKVVGIFSGHHTLQAGKLGLLDPARGRQENSGAQLIAPRRPTRAERIDAYGQHGELFQYPYPLSETEFLVAYAPQGWKRQPTLFKIYWVTEDGRRELLAADPELSCNQPVPLSPRQRPPLRPSLVDYRKESGTYCLQDVYRGDGLAGIPRGTIRKLRVIALDYRAAGIGCNYNHGPAGDALVSTPVAVGNGSWDIKVVLGETEVHEDGSACFTVPARTPVYFQALDDRGYAVQTMRSWSTLQPGETASCVGCHESKNQSPHVNQRPSLAMQAGPQALEPFYGPTRGFSFVREIQPLLNRHCVRCHQATVPADSTAKSRAPEAERHELAFSLRDTPVVDEIARRRWTEGYLGLAQAVPVPLDGRRYFRGRNNDLVNWIGAQSVPDLLPPYHRGAATSRLLRLLTDGHRGVKLSREELEKVACWIDLQVPFCGDYTEANAWSSDELRTYDHFLHKRRAMETLERANIRALLGDPEPANSGSLN